MDGNNLMKLANLLGMASRPSKGYRIAEGGKPEVVTAEGAYYPFEKGEVIPLESRKEGGSVSSVSPSSDTEKEKLAILRDIISVIKPRQGMESRQFGGSVSPDGKVPIMDEIEKSKYDIFKAAMSVLKPQKQSLNERTSAYGSPPRPSQFAPSLPTTPSLPGLPKPITSSSYGMMPDTFKPSEGEALWQKKRAEQGWENPAEDLWTHKRKEAGVFDLTSRQYGGFVSPDEEEIRARKRWEIPSYPERRLEEVRNILGPSVLGVQPGFQESYYEAHPEERLMDIEEERVRPIKDAILKAIEDERIKGQGYGVGFGPTPNELRLGRGRGREQPSEIPALVQGLKGLTPTLIAGGRRGSLPTGVKTQPLTAQTETNEDKYSVSMYNKMYRDLSDSERNTVDTRLQGLKPPRTTEELVASDLERTLGRKPNSGEILNEMDRRKQQVASGGISPLPPGTLSTPKVKGVKNETALEGLSEEQKGIVRGLTSYNYPWPGSFAMRDPKWQALMGRAEMYDPDFDAKEYQVRFNLRRDFTSGKAANNIRAINTLVGHLDSLNNAGDELANSENRVWNWIKNRGVGTVTGVPQVQKFLSAATAVENELASVFRGTGAATIQEIKEWRKTLNELKTPSEIKVAIQMAVELMGSRMKALEAQYESGIGKPKDFSFLSPQSTKILEKMGMNPTDLDPNVGTTIPQQYSQEDLEFTAKKYGITVEEVRKRLRGGM